MDDATQQPLFDDEGIKAVEAAPDTAPVVIDQTTGSTDSEELDDELRTALAASDRGDVTAEQLDVLSARNDAWLEANADPITTDEFAAIFQQLKISVPDIPHDPDVADDDHIKLLFHSLWHEHRIILASSNRFYRVHAEPPRWLQGLLDLIDIEPTKRPPRRSIAPAFVVAGREGVGRISSSQVSDAIFEAFIAPKGKWEATAKGWPKYCSRRGNVEIFLTLRPEVVDIKNIAAERAAMEQIRDELSIRDWDSLTALMAQVLREGRPNASAFAYADTLLDYRQIERKKGKDGYTAGHQQNMRFEQATSIHRLAHLYVTTETLKIRRLNEKGRAEYDAVDWNEKVLQLQGNATRREDDTELAWDYRLGPWFTTFLEKPNRFVAYILQRALSYHPTKEQWTKQLAHYLTLELRKNADNGRELRRTVGELLDKAGIPVSARYPNKARDRLEQAVRDVVSDNLFRIVHDGKVLDGTSPEIETWTASSKTLPARNWFAAYTKEVIVFRADRETEELYDGEIRHNTLGGQKKGGSTPASSRR